MCQTNKSIPGKTEVLSVTLIATYVHLDQSNNSYIMVLCVNVAYVSAGGIASPSLMPGQTVDSLIYLQRWSSYELWMPAYVHMLIFA